MPSTRPTQALTQRTVGAEWLAATEHALDAALAVSGLRRSGPLIAVRSRPWSWLARAPTSEGAVWCKQPCAAMSFEAPLQARLAELAPARFQAPLAVSLPTPELLITSDHGSDLGADGPVNAATWAELLSEVAQLQRRCAGHPEDLLRAGLPNHAPSQLGRRFEELVSALVALPPGDPHALTRAERADLEQAAPSLQRHTATLEASGLPATWQHGDLHPGNVYRGPTGDLRLFDLGDGQWAHPFESLCVPHEVLSRQGQLPTFASAVDRYLAAWHFPREEFEALWPSVQAAYAINRATTWWSCLAEATQDEWKEWGAAPKHHLQALLRFT